PPRPLGLELKNLLPSPQSKFKTQNSKIDKMPLIIDPIPSGRPLPFMQTIQDAARLNIQERTTFYVSAYLFQCWISQLTLDYSAQLAEKPDPDDRSFQTGESWRGFQKFFAKASDAEFPEFYIHLMQFAAH